MKHDQDCLNSLELLQKSIGSLPGHPSLQMAL
jgi:hypothetical protein